MSIRVVIVDDHAILRSGLSRVLSAEPDIEVVGEAASADRAVFEALASKPDVIVMDVVMPGKSGIEGIPAVLQAVPGVKVLMLSMQDDPRYVREAFAVGASGYVLKEAADTEVVGAVRAVASGERYVHPALGARLIAADADERRRAEDDPLSEREREVLPAAGARAHEPGDREAPLHLGAHGRDAPRAHHAEAPAHEPCGAGALRPRERPDRGDGLTPQARRPRTRRRGRHLPAPPSSLTPGGRSDQWPAAATFVVIPGCFAASSRKRPPRTASARIIKPKPVSSSATPTTIPNSASCSAM